MAVESVEESEIRSVDLDKHIKMIKLTDACLKKSHVKVHPSLSLYHVCNAISLSRPKFSSVEEKILNEIHFDLIDISRRNS